VIDSARPAEQHEIHTAQAPGVGQSAEVGDGDRPVRAALGGAYQRIAPRLDALAPLVDDGEAGAPRPWAVSSPRRLDLLYLHPCQPLTRRDVSARWPQRGAEARTGQEDAVDERPEPAIANGSAEAERAMTSCAPTAPMTATHCTTDRSRSVTTGSCR
jgi:hypothetical protein